MTITVNPVPLASPDSRQHLRDSLPLLRTLPDDAAVAALEALYYLGAEAGIESAQAVVAELGDWLTRLVVARQKQDAEAVCALVDAFIAARCTIKGGPAPTPQR